MYAAARFTKQEHVQISYQGCKWLKPTRSPPHKGGDKEGVLTGGGCIEEALVALPAMERGRASTLRLLQTNRNILKQQFHQLEFRQYDAK